MHGSFTHGARGGLSGEKTWKKRSGGEFLLLRATVGFALEASDGLDEAHSRCGRFTPQQLAHGAATSAKCLSSDAWAKHRAGLNDGALQPGWRVGTSLHVPAATLSGWGGARGGWVLSASG